MAHTRTDRRLKIKKRSRLQVAGRPDRPRLCVYRSNAEIYAQIIDDESGKTLLAVSSFKNTKAKGNKIEKAAFVGKEIAEKATSNGIAEVVFDRNGFLYHGRIKSLAEAAREGGLKF
jgi:large subunit ribosomal protein L18